MARVLSSPRLTTTVSAGMFRACWAQPSRIIVSSSSHSSLHTSAVLRGQSSRQHVARAIRKSNIVKQEERQREAQENKPHVILGMRRGKEGEWEKCLLAKILITEEELGISNELVPTEQTIGTVYLPKQFNFGVGEAEKQLLFKSLPILTSMGGKDYVKDKKRTEDAISATNSTGTRDAIPATDSTGTGNAIPATNSTGTGDAIPEYVSIESLEEEQNVWRKNIVKEHGKANAFARVIDLRNANAAGIAYENRRRIIEAFSTPQNPFDPGRSEVQAALLTYRIRNLWNHLTTFKRDLGNLRGLRMLVHQRAKILRYLKKVDQNRYEIVLQQLALEPESVEGELVV
ncbi:hypothetical protein H2248_001428 [Termitomyces sp. 'cryptogamus']|nr:hypothetical protein H2248_001428 [Termitomyces sp. 'cryptogamus']